MARSALQLTRSKRLARALRLRYADEAQGRGQGAYAAPDIQTTSACLESLWQQYGVFSGADQLLSEQQARAAWRRLVATEFEAISDPGIVARLYDTYRLACDWNVDAARASEAATTQDLRTYARIASAYDGWQRQHGWLDPGRVVFELNQWTPTGTLPAAVTFTGFVRPTPAEQLLGAWFENQGCEVSFEGAGDALVSGSVVGYNSPEAEALAAGVWARTRLQRQADARLAVVSLYPEEQRRQLADRLLDTLQPDWQRLGRSEWLDIAAAPPLASYPLPRIAAIAMRGLLAPMKFETLSALLRHPLIAGEDGSDLAALELAIRAMPERSWTIKEVLNWSARSSGESTRTNAMLRLRQAEAELEEFSETNTLAHWAEAIDRILADLLGQQESQLGSEEWQLAQAMSGSVNQLASLGDVAGRMRGRDAVHLWVQLLQQTRYQPEGNASAVDLLGPYDVVGGHYDAIWVMGLDTNHWPPRVSSNPFLAISLQRELSMPGANPAEDLSFAAELERAICACAPELKQSYALETHGVVNRPAGLGKYSPSEPVSDVPLQSAAAALANTSPLKVSPEPFVGPASQTEVSGGHGVLALMHDQPFLAFCGYRLAAAPLERPVVGVGARQRGILLHRAAEHLYRSETSTNRIDAAAIARIAARIPDVVRQIYAPWSDADPALNTLMRLEAGRARAVLEALLRVDSQRAPFSVREVEQSIVGKFGPLSLSLRLDRVDHTDAGAWIVDYKTGSAKTGGVSRDELALPHEIQLGIYACAWRTEQPEPIAGMAIAELHARSVEYFSLAVDSNPRLAKRGAAVSGPQVANWQTYFAGLAADFMAGDSTLDSRLVGSDLLPYGLLAGPALTVTNS